MSQRVNLSRLRVALGFIAILGLTVAIYWPVSHAGFVWVDKIIFHDAAWLRVGDEWKTLIFHNFYDWVNYFRPLVVALFVFEVRAFDAAPMPMHLFSLALHVANTILVGVLAARILGKQANASYWAAAAMLFYGLHPALIEPVVWVSCQFELVVTFFILSSALANATIEKRTLRTFAVTLLFFLAACSKESAAALPLLLFIMDVALEQRKRPKNTTQKELFRAVVAQQWSVYLGILFAGAVYLVVRSVALGFVVQRVNGQPFFSLTHIQEICFLYVNYWRILVWPMNGLGPIHVIDTNTFAYATLNSIVTDCTAAALLLAGIAMAWKRILFGVWILAFSALLLPVLHIIPIGFDESLYHERYAMTAIAAATFLAPLTFATVFSRFDWKTWLAALMFAGWIAIAVLNIRVTLPIWSDEGKLWQWVLRETPDSATAKTHLLSTYLELDDRPRARKLADQMLAEKTPCQMCWVNIAYLAAADRDLARATAALDEAIRQSGPNPSDRFVQAFILATGQVRELQGDLAGAQEAYLDAISMDPKDPQAQMNLALLLASERKFPEAHSAMEKALLLFAPDEREKRWKIFEHAVAAVAPQPES